MLSIVLCCFQGDGDLFQIGYEYTLPEQLPHTRTLREGGNGTVLEVLQPLSAISGDIFLFLTGLLQGNFLCCQTNSFQVV